MSQATVSILALGGTIAMRGAAGSFATLDADELIASVPALEGTARLRSATFRELPGAHLSLADILALAGAVHEEFQRGADGVVITQGTDTIEEVAFMLDLLVESSGPVVVTGAMRSPQLEGADGPANLLAAVQAAASPDLQGLGCVVVLGERNPRRETDPEGSHLEPIGVHLAARRTDRVGQRGATADHAAAPQDRSACPARRRPVWGGSRW